MWAQLDETLELETDESWSESRAFAVDILIDVFSKSAGSHRRLTTFHPLENIIALTAVQYNDVLKVEHSAI